MTVQRHKRHWGRTVAPYDVVVIGAGPAGSAAAIGMAIAGWHILLVDKAAFPRDKVCGDFLSPRSLAALEALGCLDAVQRAQPYSVGRSAVYLNGELLSVGLMPEISDLPGYGLVVPRMVLDEILFRRAEELSVDTVQGFAVQELSVNSCGVTVSGHSGSNSRIFTTRLVIIADGARSRLASRAGLPRDNGKPDLFALRAYFEGVRCDPDTAAIFFGEAYFPGYAWVFPIGGGRANVGMGMAMDASRHYQINLRECFVRWLAEDPGLQEMLRGARLDGRIVGWPLTTYRGNQVNYGDRVLVVGDAGYFVDPINGEGIHTALETAQLAVRTADEALATNNLTDSFLSVYERRWRAAFDLDLRTSDLMVTAVKNRALLRLWLLVLRMIAERSRTDLQFATRCGGILAGVVPSHRGMSPDLAVKTMLQPPDFWARNHREIREVLATLLGIGGAKARATQEGRDLVRESEYVIGWALNVMIKTWRVSDGLAKAYGVPWAVGGRLVAPAHAAAPGYAAASGRAMSRAPRPSTWIADELPRLVLRSAQESS
jgi:geranylgeranyl reductase family protein